MRLYDDLAELWPLLSPPEDYAAEAGIVRELLVSHGLTEGTVMELGAGGGHTLIHLADIFDCTAIDTSETMLAHCRALFEREGCSIETVVGDMRALRLGRRFDAVLLHDAIDYMTTPEDAAAAVATVAAHLQPGGMGLIAPTDTVETFEPADATDERAGLTITTSARRVEDTIHLSIHVERKGDVLLDETHVCGLFRESQWHTWIRSAGLRIIERVGCEGWAGWAVTPNP